MNNTARTITAAAIAATASDPDSVIAYLEDYEGTPAEAKALELIAKIKQISNI